jgi:hypothetical protein
LLNERVCPPVALPVAQPVDDDMRSQLPHLIWESEHENKTTAGITADGRYWCRAEITSDI